MRGGPRGSRLASAVLLAVFAGGCKATMTVQQYPAFYDPGLKTVAVVEFTNETPHPKAGEFLATRLAAALKANGTYAVVGPRELKAKLRAAEVPLSADADAETTAAALRRLGGIDAFVTGSAKAFSAESFSHVEIEPGYVRGWYGWGYPSHGWGYPWHGGWGYPWYGHGYGGPLYRRYTTIRAHAAADAALIRVADAETIHVAPSAAAARIRSPGYPRKTADECLIEAAEAAVRGLVEAFAVMPRQLRLDVGKTLRTARRRKGGGLKFTDDFRARDETMCVVLRLPRQAARNPFRLAITRKGREEALAEKDLVWSHEDTSREFTFSPRQLAEAAGTGKFELRFYSGGHLVLKRKFDIER